MKAIVLTCDRYRALTEHMLFQYDRLWPDHPFEWHVPYQFNADPRLGVTYVQTPVDIRATVLTLLQGIPDDEWIYWAIDDKYPTYIEVDRVKMLMKWLPTADVSGLLFVRSKVGYDQRCLTGVEIDTGDVRLLEQNVWQIWPHQFIRAGVLRKFYEPLEEHIDLAFEMDVLKKRSPVPLRKMVTWDSFMVMGESTVKRDLTTDCHDSIVQYGLRLPDWFDGTKAPSTIIGRKTI